MKLAKQCLDVGLFTNNIEPMLEFWQQGVGLPFEELLPTGGGSRQHRHGLNGGVLKINEVRDALPASAPAGYRELVIPRSGVSESRSLTDPDGNRVTLVPLVQDGSGIEIRLGVTNLEAARRHYGLALGFDRVSEDVYACGTTRLVLDFDPDQQPIAEMRGVGYRYLTVQVWDADAEFSAVVAAGATAGMAPRTLGAVARFGFVRDPDGNWMEISQRASLTGNLPPN
ncbi:MAG: VOC family protein [bacterium]